MITLNKCQSESPPVRNSEAIIKCKARLPRSYFLKKIIQIFQHQSGRDIVGCVFLSPLGQRYEIRDKSSSYENGDKSCLCKVTFVEFSLSL